MLWPGCTLAIVDSYNLNISMSSVEWVPNELQHKLLLKPGCCQLRGVDRLVDLASADLRRG